MRDRVNQISLAIIVLLTAFAIYVVWPSKPGDYLPGFIPWPHGHGITLGTAHRNGMQLGLDLQGGTRTVVQADRPAGFSNSQFSDAMKTAQSILEKRVNKFGLTEAQVTRQGSNRIAVDIPGANTDQAQNLIGKTALLEFREPQNDPNGNGISKDSSGNPVFIPACKDYGCPNGEQPLTGKLLKPNAFVTSDAAGQPEVSFEFTAEGAKIFGAVTGRNIQRPVAIYLDDVQLTAPIVQSQITDKGVIQGQNLNPTQLVAQLNAGALPLPIHVVQQTNVDASLGKDSVNKTVFAGEIGFLAVALFMILFYRLPGVLATLALCVYTSVNLMVYKLVPVTLTLPGIAAFVLSIGIAVDANILIFERTKEELRRGLGLSSAIDTGFRRAWPSIRDSNISTIMTSLILFWFGDQFGAALVKGFALNLAIGVIISLFSSILVTRLFLRLTVGTRLGRSHWMFGAQRPQYTRKESELPRPERRRLPGFLNLVGNRKWYYALSIAITIPGLLSLAFFHLRPGIEFTSGTTFTLRFQQPPSQGAIEDALRGYNLGDPTVTTKGNNEYLIQFNQTVSPQTLQDDLARDFSVDKFTATDNGGDLKLKLPPSAAAVQGALRGDLGSQVGLHNQLKDTIIQGASNNELIAHIGEIPGNVTSSDSGPAEPTALDSVRNALIAKFGLLTDTQNHVTNRLIDSDTVSATVSSDIVKDSIYAVLAASLAILFYITWAFRAVKNPFRYGATAIIALLHDVIVVVGLFSIFGVLFKTEVDTIFLTGLLTVIGFSVHDTIVVFDRIRENSQRGISRDFEVTVNESLLQTLDRSLSTSLTVIFTLIALLLLGGDTIRTFILTLLIGITSGTYSSIAVASQLLVEWEKHNPDRYVIRFLGKLGIHRRARTPGIRPQPRQPVV